jgi:hypothetical protein
VELLMRFCPRLGYLLVTTLLVLPISCDSKGGASGSKVTGGGVTITHASSYIDTKLGTASVGSTTAYTATWIIKKVTVRCYQDNNGNASHDPGELVYFVETTTLPTPADCCTVMGGSFTYNPTGGPPIRTQTIVEDTAGNEISKRDDLVTF